MSSVESEPPYLYPAGVLAHGNLPFRRRKGRRAGKQGRKGLGARQELLMPALQRQRQEDLSEFQAKREEGGGAGM